MPVSLHFSCLGTVQLQDASGVSLESVLAQPKRLALFSYLLLADPESTQSRDALLGIFWPESEEANARASLRQAVRWLRRELGPDVVLSRGRNWVGIDCDAISCDVWRVETLLEAGDGAAALDLYGGELLHGLDLRGSPAFEQWLSGRRRGLASRVAGAAGGLAEAARDQGDAESAVRHARRALEIEPRSEDHVRRLMGIQLWAGDRAAALATYGAFEERLAAEFEAQPSIRTRELAERARGAAAGASPVSDPVTATPIPSAAGKNAFENGVSIPLHVAPDRVRESGRSAPRPALRGRRRVGYLAAGLAVGILITAVAGTAMVDRSRGAVEGEPEAKQQLVILPFEVRSSDASLNLLSRGMADLLWPVFEGDGAPVEAVREPDGDARLAPSAGAAVRRARDAGARWFVTGEVLGDHRRVHIQATLGDVTGSRPPSSTSITGSADSVYVLAGELGVRLLALAAGAPADEAVLLGRTSPEALRAYLGGRDAFSRGRYQEADEQYRAALRHDSLFAQAAVGLLETHLTAPWLHGHAFATALPLAFRLKERLSAADREIVTAVAGPWYPAPSTQGEHYRAWGEALRHAPHRVSVWYQWGDALYHVGPYIGVPDWRDRARAAFLRGLAVDPAYLPPLIHLVELAVEDGELDIARGYLDRLTSSAPGPENADYLRWRIALAAGDARELERLRSRFAGMTLASQRAIVDAAQWLGAGLDDAERIITADVDHWRSPSERRRKLEAVYFYLLNRGHSARAAAILQATGEDDPGSRQILYLAVRDALFADGEKSEGARAARRIAELAEAGPESARVADLCVLESWKVRNGDRSSIRQSLEWLDAQAEAALLRDDRRPEWCRMYLEGLSALDGSPDEVAVAAGTLRAMVEEGVAPPGVDAQGLRQVALELLERSGDVSGAFDLVRLRSSVPHTLSHLLRHQARLAALVGDTATARASYAHYLVLRADPEPRLVPQRDSVLSEYAALNGRN